MDDHIDNEENVENINDTNVQNEEVRQETKNVDQEVNVVTTDAENPPEKIDATTSKLSAFVCLILVLFGQHD